MSISKGQKFRELLNRSQGLVLCGVHDGLSAKLAERAGFQGLWASGFGLAASMAVPDTEVISLGEHLAACRRINRASRLPLVAEINDGFGDVLNVVRAVREYEAAGIAAICLDDNDQPKHRGSNKGMDRRLVSLDLFAAKIRAAKDHQCNEEFAVVARTGALAAHLGLQEALERAHAYADAGADLVLLHDEDSEQGLLHSFAERWDRDVPLAAVPTANPNETTEVLRRHGYRMIVFLDHPLRAAISHMDTVMRALVTTGSPHIIEDEICTVSEVFSLVDFEEVNQLNARYVQSIGSTREVLFDCIVSAHLPARVDAPALQFQDRTFSYGQLQTAVTCAMNVFRGCGVGDGDRVMLVLQNSPEFVIAFFAVTSLGAIVAPIDPQAGAERFRFIARDVAPLFILTDEPDQLPSDIGPPVYRPTLAHGSAKFSLSPEPRAVRQSASVSSAGTVGCHSPASIFSTSGTTGRPKGVVINHGHYLAVARMLSNRVGMTDTHRELIFGPLAHSSSWQRVTSTLLVGGFVLIAENFLSPSVLFDDIRQHAINGFFIPPPFVRMILKLPVEKLQPIPPSLRTLEIAGAPLTAEELEQLIARLPGVDVWLQYGLTECSRSLMLDARKQPLKLHTIGKPTAGIEVAIFSPDCEPLAYGENGQIVLRSLQRPNHYWNRPDLDRSRFRDGWLLTGDYGYIDEEGFVVMQGRKDDMINCGGFSYFPTEVEVALGPLEGVRAYVVAGVPDPHGVLNEVPWLFVAPLSPASWQPEQAMSQARGRLPTHMVPRNVVIASELPIDSAGKVNRRLAVQRYGPQGDR